MDIKTSDTRLLCLGHNELYTKVLFFDKDGEPIYEGDYIEFDLNEEFPSQGIVTTDNGLQIKCYNLLLDKWIYHNLIKGDD